MIQNLDWIKVQVRRMFLYGFSQEKIAQELNISEGTVSSLMQELRKSDDTLNLQHEIAVLCKKHNTSINQLASNFAFSNAIKLKAFDENRINILVDALNSIASNDGGMSAQSVAHLLLQICNLTLKAGLTPQGLYQDVKTKLEELKRLSETIEEEKRVLLETQQKNKSALHKYNLTRADIQEFVAFKEALEEAGLDFDKKEQVVNFLSNLKENKYNYPTLSRKMKQTRSIESYINELELKSDERVKVLQILDKKWQNEDALWNTYVLSKKDFAMLTQKGISPYDMFQIFDVIKKYMIQFPIEDFVKDFDTYGGLKSAIYKLTRDLQTLKAECEIWETKNKWMNPNHPLFVK
jgi:transcriptional regulator with XRE-family HTH domain